MACVQAMANSVKIIKKNMSIGYCTNLSYIYTFGYTDLFFFVMPSDVTDLVRELFLRHVQRLATENYSMRRVWRNALVIGSTEIESQTLMFAMPTQPIVMSDF